MTPSWVSAGVLLLWAAGVASAQANEIWPELDVFWRPAEHQRSFLELSRSADRDSPKSSGTVGLYQDYLWLPTGYLRGGFRYSFSTSDASYRESRIVGEAVVTALSHGLARLLTRSRLELRWVNGQYSYRIRERLHLQRVPPKPKGLALAPYGTFEAYYYSQYRTIARLAGRLGSEAQLARRVSIDLYVARQDNSRETPRYVNALGITARLSY